MRLIAIFFPEGDGHGLQLAPGNAGESFVVVLGNEDAVTTPTTFFRVGAAAGNDIPHILILRGEGQGQADIDAAKESDRLANLDQVREFGIGEGDERVATKSLLPPIVENVEFHTAG